MPAPPSVTDPATSDIVVRAMTEPDVPGAFAAADLALREAGTRYGWHTPELDDAARTRGQLRHAHLLRTDPDGAWVAEAGGRIVGVAFALVRGPLWYLSLLTVTPDVQAQGVGRCLIDRALQTSQGCSAGMIMASSDPKALRRYAAAGFALLPGYDATGRVDRRRLPAVPGVRDGDWAADGERVDDLGRRLRGASYGPDLAAMRDSGMRLLVADDGFAGVNGGELRVLGAADPGTARSLLWAALAEAEGEVELGPLTAAQQWAIEVALQAGLSLRPGTSLCTRGSVGPLTPYLPSGAYG